MTRISFTTETEAENGKLTNFGSTEVLAELKIIVDTFFRYDSACYFEFKNILVRFKTSAIVTIPTNRKNFKLTRALLLPLVIMITILKKQTSL